MARKEKFPLLVYKPDDAGNLTKIKEILQRVCDRSWEDESLYTTAVIVSNAMIARDVQIKNLNDRIELLISYFEKRAKENYRRATEKEKDSEIYAQATAYEVAAEFLHSSYYLSGKSDTYKRAADKLREYLVVKQEEKQSWPFGW